MKKQIILGSKSMGRRMLLDRAGIQYETMSADIDEKSIRDADPLQLVLRLAHAKADTLIEKCGPETILITSDCVVVCNGELLEKPVSKEEVYHSFELYGKFPVSVISSVVVTNCSDRLQKEFVDATEIIFSPFSEVEIGQIAAEENTYMYAGGFTIEHPIAVQHTISIQGDRSTIIGMPMKKTLEFIASFDT